MAIVITGSEGNVGRRLMRAFAGAVGVDAQPGAAIVADLATVDYAAGPLRDALADAEAVIHLAACADPHAPDSVHWRSTMATTRLFVACAEIGVPRVIAASSGWAEPAAGLYLNAYAHSKRVVEALAAMYDEAAGRTGIAIRVGWVPGDPAAVAAAPPLLARDYWDDARLVAEFRAALAA